MKWFKNINSYCLPIFEYVGSGFIKGHRGRNIGFGENVFVAVGMFTKPGIDFSGGRFYLNKNADVSKDGKDVYRENIATREYFNIPQGSVILFDNRLHIHGTELSKGHRVTASWRIDDI